MSEGEKQAPEWHRPGKPGRKIVRHSLTTLAGCITEIARTYRHFKAGKLDAEEARTRVYMLDKLRAGLEAEALGELQQRLDELETNTAGRALGHSGEQLLALPPH